LQKLYAYLYGLLHVGNVNKIKEFQFKHYAMVGDFFYNMDFCFPIPIELVL
jgi:hypothetical protein